MVNRPEKSKGKRPTFRVFRFILIILTTVASTGFIALMAASGVLLKPVYLEPWNKTYYQKFDDPRIQLTAHGLLAANGHNMQPWKIRLDGDKDVFYLFSDGTRLTKQVDPYARQQMITQGTFLEYVKEAGAKLGYRAEISLFPDGAPDESNLAESMAEKPVAKIVLSKTQAAESPLYDSMFLPDTNRTAYRSDKLTDAQIQGITAAGNDADLKTVLYQDEDNVAKIGAVALQGTKIEAGVHRANLEAAAVFRANEYQKNHYRYGFSLEGQGTNGFLKHILQGLITIFPTMNSEKASSDLMIQTAETAAGNTPAYGMIISAGNSREEQVKSGMLYSRIVLTAHTMGLAVQPLSQVLEEYPEMNELYQSVHAAYAGEGGTIQMLFRIGVPAEEAARSMRRDVLDLVQ